MMNTVIKRRRCREIKIGSIKIGGNNPVVIQSMAKTFTSDLPATLREIRQLRNAGCQVVRVAVRDNKDAETLREIKQRIAIPLVADIHFDKNLALKAIDSGVDKIRLNPGNIYKKSEIKEIAKAARDARIPIRVGVNSGSITRYSLLATRYSKNLAQLMVKCALDYIKLLESFGFYDIVVSLKGSDIFSTIQANQKIAKSCNYPLHLGVTATGPNLMGIIKSAIVIGRLLFEGIGDTIRISLTDRAVEEVKVAYRVLAALGLGNKRPEIISCPTCGRCEVDLIKIVQKLELSLSNLSVLQSASLPVRKTDKPVDSKTERLVDRRTGRLIKVAVMGCVVNGPGEARTADLGIAFGKEQGLLFSKGKPVKKVSSSRCVEVLLQELNKTDYYLNG